MPDPPKRSNSKLNALDKKRNRQPSFMKSTLSKKGKEQPSKPNLDIIIQRIHELVLSPKSIGNDSVSNAQNTLCQLQAFRNEAQTLLGIPEGSNVTCFGDLADLILKEIKNLRSNLTEKDANFEQQKQVTEFFQRKKQEADNNLQLKIIESEELTKEKQDLEKRKQDLEKRQQDLEKRLATYELELKQLKNCYNEEKKMWERKHMTQMKCEWVEEWVNTEPNHPWKSDQTDSKNLVRPMSALHRINSAVSTLSCANSGKTNPDLFRKDTGQTDTALDKTWKKNFHLRRKNSGQTDISFANSSEFLSIVQNEI